IAPQLPIRRGDKHCRQALVGASAVVMVDRCKDRNSLRQRRKHLPSQDEGQLLKQLLVRLRREQNAYAVLAGRERKHDVLKRDWSGHQGDDLGQDPRFDQEIACGVHASCRSAYPRRKQVASQPGLSRAAASSPRSRAWRVALYQASAWLAPV